MKQKRVKRKGGDGRRDPERHALFYVSPHLLAVATSAYERMDKGTPAKQPGDHHNALPGIVFSAAALEAFLGEVVGLGRGLGNPAGRDDTIRRFATLMTDADERNTSIRFRYQLAKSLLDGKPYDKGASPYQEFELLITLRDAILHMQPNTYVFTETGEVRMTFHDVRDRLLARGVVPRLQPRAEIIPFQWLTTRALVRWCVNASVGMMISILDAVPKGSFRAGMDSIYREPFQMITGPSSNDSEWVEEGITMARKSQPSNTSDSGEQA